MKKKVIAIIVTMVMVLAFIAVGNSTYTVTEKHYILTQNMGYVLEVTETEKTRFGETLVVIKHYYDIFEAEVDDEPYGSYVVYEK